MGDLLELARGVAYRESIITYEESKGYRIGTEPILYMLSKMQIVDHIKSL